MIIALIAKRKSGKTTAARMLEDLYPNFQRAAFANVFKQKFAEFYQMNLESLHSTLQKEKYRELMQNFSDITRKVDPDVWVNYVVGWINAHPGDYIIEDVRFLNELEAVLKLGAHLIKIQVDVRIRKNRGMQPDPLVDNHISENDVCNLSSETIMHLGGHTVYNNKSEHDLRQQIMNAFEEIKKEEAIRLARQEQLAISTITRETDNLIAITATEEQRLDLPAQESPAPECDINQPSSNNLSLL